MAKDADGKGEIATESAEGMANLVQRLFRFRLLDSALQ